MRLTQGIVRAAMVRGKGTAIIDGAQSFTWAEVADRVPRLAAVLRAHGLTEGGRVVLLAHNSHWSIEAFYAAFYAGGVMVPLNFRLSEQDLAVQVADCQPDVLLLGPDFLHLGEGLRAAAGGTARVLAVDETLGALTRAAEPIADAMRGGDDLACIYYTSGTTSAAKGVMLSHANFMVNTLNVSHTLELGEQTVHMHHGPLFHLAAGARLFSVTQAAGTHVFLPRFQAGEVLAEIGRSGVTHLTVVPTMLRTLLDDPALASTDLSSLRYLSYGSAPMPEPLLREALERLPHVRFIQSYGMTELSPVATMLDWEDHLPSPRSSALLKSAGKPVATVEIAVIAPDGTHLPTGSHGEIAVRGPTVMMGYWNRPDLTQATIRNGWLHTGDIGFIDDEGYLTIADRLKDMIITGGENVFSQEVEQALSTHPAVSQCAVFGLPDAKWGEAVHAVVTLHAGAETSSAELVAHCRDLLAHYKCPRSVDIRTAPMPLSGSNKIQKSDLRAEILASRADA
ncbi:AMP-binding protein [Novosphingobium sp.]|uniref:AMP-binding protein n=1 Tax=Novosphingobium sp. TaxID=1874826 RepID=UPI001EB8073C|nr:AMP-binding protein [Novosphingobium sp.]MBK9009630.1 AMP-binding protein [Novosphingobium sp.]